MFINSLSYFTYCHIFGRFVTIQCLRLKQQFTTRLQLQEDLLECSFESVVPVIELDPFACTQENYCVIFRLDVFQGLFCFWHIVALSKKEKNIKLTG